jgi:hypothetical protein
MTGIVESGTDEPGHDARKNARKNARRNARKKDCGPRSFFPGSKTPE